MSKKTHGVQLLIRCVVRDPDGKIISDTGRKPSRSFVIQFLEFIGYMFDGPVGDQSATATDGTEDPIYSYVRDADYQFRCDAGINESLWGVVVGTGDTAEDNADYALATQLTEGEGAGNITHGVVIFVAAAEVGANVDLEIKRAFTNGTGDAITVKEAGIYVHRSYSPLANHCIIRDVLAASVEVPDKCSLTVIYTIRTTV